MNLQFIHTALYAAVQAMAYTCMAVALIYGVQLLSMWATGTYP